MLTKRFALSAFLLLVLSLVAFPNSAYCQKKNKEKKTEFKGSPEKILKEANQLYALQRYSRAKEAYIAVLKKDPENFLATVRTAKCSYYIQEYEEAARYFESALEIDKNANDTVYFDLGVTYRVLDRHNDAKEVLTEFRKRWKEQDIYAKRVKLELKGCAYVDSVRNIEPEWRISCLDINSGMGDNFPALLTQTEGENYIVFTSSRIESKSNEIFEGYNEGFSDLWIAKQENDTTFGIPENMGKKVNTKGNDGNATFTPDGMVMYTSICNSGKMGYGCSIFKSDYDPLKKSWLKAKVVEELQGKKEVVINSRGKIKKVPTYDVHPMLSADGNTIYFASDRDGGYGRLDIWYATWEGDKWSEPMNLGERLNTGFDDMTPFPAADGKSFYFSSNGRKGFGGFDLYKSTGSVGAWSEPENLGAPINSTYDDLAGWWSKDDSSAYITSNRPGCTGRDDIFWVKKKEKPPVVYAVHGLVLDTKSKMPIPFATVILFEIDFEGDLIPIDTFRTDQSATYNFDLEGEKDYKVLGNAPEYLANEEKFTTKALTPEDTVDLEVNINIELERIIIEKPIVLNNIYYDYDKADLRPESITELNKLVDLLTKNDNIKVRIGSHTDSNGSETYNKRLSENRAKSVVTYLIQSGIVGDRLEWFGYGESELIYFPEKNDEEEQMNRRTEFRILSIDFSENGN